MTGISRSPVLGHLRLRGFWKLVPRSAYETRQDGKEGVFFKVPNSNTRLVTRFASRYSHLYVPEGPFHGLNSAVVAFCPAMEQGGRSKLPPEDCVHSLKLFLGRGGEMRKHFGSLPSTAAEITVGKTGVHFTGTGFERAESKKALLTLARELLFHLPNAHGVHRGYLLAKLGEKLEEFE